MESEPGVINPLDSIWTLLRMSPAFLLRDARHAMYDIFFCTSLPVCCLSLLRLKCQLLSGVPVYLVFPPAIYGYTHSIPGWTDLACLMQQCCFSKYRLHLVGISGHLADMCLKSCDDLSFQILVYFRCTAKLRQCAECHP